MSIIPNGGYEDDDDDERESKRVRTQEIPWSYFRDLLPDELKYIVHESLDYESLKNLCGVDKYWSQICGTELGKKIMKKKYIEMNFDRYAKLLDLENKGRAGTGFDLKNPKWKYVGVSKDGETTTDIALMYYERPKYCVHLIENGTTRVSGRRKAGSLSPGNIVEQIVKIHNESLKDGTEYSRMTGHCADGSNVILIEESPDNIITRLAITMISKANGKGVPMADIKYLQKNPLSYEAWNQKSIRRRISRYLHGIKPEEFFKAAFPEESSTKGTSQFTIQFN